jgi:hypothetical protein
MKIIALLLFLMFFTTPLNTAAQDACASGGGSSLVLIGLRLNMSPEQVQGVFGKDLKITVKKDDEKIIFQNYIEKPAPASLAGVRALYLRFFNRKLYQAEIFYEDAPGIKTLADFTARLSGNWNLPASSGWREENRKAFLTCGEYTAVADKILNPHVEITDETARTQVEAIRKEQSKKN